MEFSPRILQVIIQRFIQKCYSGIVSKIPSVIPLEIIDISSEMSPGILLKIPSEISESERNLLGVFQIFFQKMKNVMNFL